MAPIQREPSSFREEPAVRGSSLTPDGLNRIMCWLKMKRMLMRHMKNRLRYSAQPSPAK
jgi:hypothetical protein